MQRCSCNHVRSSQPARQLRERWHLLPTAVWQAKPAVQADGPARLQSHIAQLVQQTLTPAGPLAAPSQPWRLPRRCTALQVLQLQAELLSAAALQGPLLAAERGIKYFIPLEQPV